MYPVIHARRESLGLGLHRSDLVTYKVNWDLIYQVCSH